MAYASPIHLDAASAARFAKEIVRSAETKVRRAMDKRNVFMATASSDPKKSENNHSCHEALMDNILDDVTATLSTIKKFCESMPSSSTSCGATLRYQIEHQTEVDPTHDGEFPLHLVCFTIKLLLLDEVFIDRDYGDKDIQCLIPFAWEQWVARLTRRISPFSCWKIQFYGGMYPSIIEAILQGCPSLRSLSISHINITEDLLLLISNTCKNLEQLYLYHAYPWQVISEDAFCESFFGADYRNLQNRIKSNQAVSIKFPLLKELELSYGNIGIAKLFHKLLLSHYEKLTTVCSDWKISIFEDGYQKYCSELILPQMLKGNHIQLKCLYVDSDTLSTMDPGKAEGLALYLQNLSEIKVDCNIRSASSVGRAMLVAGSHLKLILTKSKVRSLHVNIASQNRITVRVLVPSLEAMGHTLQELTVEASSPTDKFYITTLSHLLSFCSTLQSLQLRLWNKAMLEPPSQDLNSIDIQDMKSLRDLSLFEDGPGDSVEDATVEQQLALRWESLLNSLIAASPALETLCFTVCQTLACLLQNISCNARTLHMHFKDGYEWQPDVEIITKFLQKFPCLEQLYLEEIDGGTFWKLKRHYHNTCLRIHWGNMSGWPRS